MVTLCVFCIKEKEEELALLTLTDCRWRQTRRETGTSLAQRVFALHCGSVCSAAQLEEWE